MIIVIRFIYILLISTILSGCSVSTHFYLRNITDAPVILKAHSFEKDGLIRNVPYTESIMIPDYNLYKSMNLQIEPFQVEGNDFYYKMAPRSTCFIGKGSNFKNLYFDTIVLMQNDHEIINLNWRNTEILKKDKVFLNKYYAWYDVEATQP